MVKVKEKLEQIREREPSLADPVSTILDKMATLEYPEETMSSLKAVLIELGTEHVNLRSSLRPVIAYISHKQAEDAKTEQVGVPLPSYDSRPDTYAHIQTVQKYMNFCIHELMDRALVHDQSKLEDPEKEIFDEFTPKLRDTTYGSDEYKEYLGKMGTALEHHYAQNDHHPEHFDEGIEGMNLLSMVEMLCDWKASTERHEDGDIFKSIDQNQERFGYSDDIKALLINTAKWLDTK